MSGNWQGSQRRASLPTNWASEARPAILRRDDHQCTWLTGIPDGGPLEYISGIYPPHLRCTEPAADVDHIGDPHDHRSTNLRALCAWHHDRRSSQQGNTARAALRAQLQLQLQPERHPGLRP